MVFPNWQTPPTYAEVVLIDPRTGIPVFNPTWLNWFIALAKALTDGGAAGPGLGTVHSVDIAVPVTILTVSGGPITVSGTITIGLADPVTGTGGIVLQVAPTLKEPIVFDYMDFTQLTIDPASPGAGIARLYGWATHGITRLRHDNEMATDQVLGQDDIFVARNNTGVTLVKGSVVYCNGEAGNVPTVALAQANNATTARAIGLVLDDISTATFGQVMNVGILASYNTNAWTPGTRLYLSAATPGALTSTRPSYPNYGKPIGTVLTQGIGNGSILVLVSPYIGGHDSGTDQPLFSVQAGSVVGAAGAGYWDFAAQSSQPAAPSAGVIRLHSFTTQGFTRLEQDNEAATNITLGRDNVFIGKNTSGSTINKGQAVYITGSTGNVPNLAVAQANTTATLPAVGLALDSITNNSFGQIMELGIIASFDTSALTVGQAVYISPTVAGGLTSTRPTGNNYIQVVGVVLVSGVGNGAVLVHAAEDFGPAAAAAGYANPLINPTDSSMVDEFTTGDLISLITA